MSVDLQMTNQEKFKETENFPDSKIPQMFDRISRKYDLLNHVLSFGLDFYWRHKLSRQLRPKDLKLIDLATGTGDSLISVLKKNPQIQESVGLDLSEKMLNICQAKLSNYKLTAKPTLVQADITEMPFEDNSFDAATIAFGIRNANNIPKAFEEIYRVLKPSGHLVILEFSQTKNRVMKTLFLFYLCWLIPLIARIFSADKGAYVYLGKSIKNFHNAEKLTQLLKNAGFEEVETRPLTLGLVCIHDAYKKG